MTHTDLILISKDKYQHLDLHQSGNRLTSILMNEMMLVEEEFSGSKQSSMIYTDDRTTRKGALKSLGDAGNNSEQWHSFNKECQLNENIKKYVDLRKKQGVKLTRTENKVMLLILNEESIPEMARTLNCSKKVIYTHKYNIIKKYGFRTFNELLDNISQCDQE